MLNKENFKIIQKLNRLAGRALHKMNLIENHENILLALSGGKDSMTLLKWLKERENRKPFFKIKAAHLNLGYENKKDNEKLKNWVENLGVPYIFEEVDYAILAHKGDNPCFICARKRRQRLFEIAKSLDCSTIAYGHHRDDALETFLLNIFYSGETSTMLAKQSFFSGQMKIIRPFYFVPESILIKAFQLWQIPAFGSACPSDHNTKRTEIRKIIEQLSLDNNNITGNIFQAMHNIRLEYLPSKSTDRK